MTKKEAIKEVGVSEVPFAAPVNQAVDVKAIHIYFDENQIPEITFSGREWNIRDILHIKRLLTREYKRHLRGFRKDVKKEE